MSRRLVLLAAACLLVALVGAGGGSAQAPTVPTVGALRICTGCASYGLTSSSRYGYVILQPWQASLIPQLKAQNPGVKVLAYKNAAATYSYACKNGTDDPSLPAGVGYCWAGANHPEWFSTDTSGARIQFCDYSGLWQMDVGAAAYQKQWLANVLADLRGGGWDGIMLDDVNESERYHLCGRTIAAYPKPSDYTAAMGSFLGAVGPGLTQAGFLVLPNIALDDWWDQTGLDLWDTWNRDGSGAILEHFSKWGGNAAQWLVDDGVHNDWSGRQALFRHTQAAGKRFVGITYAPSTDARSMRYSRASFLADWDGTSSSALLFEPTTPEAQDPYAPAWTIDVGRPLAPRTQVGVAWVRPFSGGVVVVNPSPTSAQTVPLGGAFVGPTGATVTSVTVASTDAVILPAAAPAPAAPTTTTATTAAATTTTTAASTTTATTTAATTTTTAATTTATVAKATAPKNAALPLLSFTNTATGWIAQTTTGSWTGAPTTYVIKWQRCTSTLSQCTAIAGATASSYSLVQADVGTRLRVVVTASNALGSGTVASGATAVIPKTLVPKLP